MWIFLTKQSFDANLLAYSYGVRSFQLVGGHSMGRPWNGSILARVPASIFPLVRSSLHLPSIISAATRRANEKNRESARHFMEFDRYLSDLGRLDSVICRIRFT